MTKTPLITAACGPSAMASRVQARNTGTATFWVAAGAEPVYRGLRQDRP
jgi:hypothetical protein